MREIFAYCRNKLGILVESRPGFFIARSLRKLLGHEEAVFEAERSTKSTGDYGERLAAEYLRKHGYKILEKSHRNRRGEIDLIAVEKKSRVLAFIEVKTWEKAGPGGPSDAVDQRKQIRLTAAALEYLKSNRMLEKQSRFDVVEIILGDSKPELRHYKNAFEATGAFQLHS